MKERHFSTSFTSYDSPEQLPATLQSLLAEAVNVLGRAHAPYSNFYVGAAILLKNGVVLSGANQENAAYPMCLCAERVALATAHSQYPDVPILSIAITIKNPAQVIQQPAAPCGACRQVICETEQRYQQPMQVLLRGEVGEIFVFKSGKDILPFSFDGTYL
ncbi:MAG: cytidine deaminase [Saprospiraceae bacterium]